MTRPTDLESRVTARKTELIAELIEHKLNCSRAGAAQAIDTLQARLSELTSILKKGIVGGWNNVDPSSRTRLDLWMSR